ncbi:MAG: universal stress protein [Calditrichaceae bacterium]|nr:universal stress protein [Calditrichaceae bacterium]MBN2708804.1 universal stress protein [Calditrichaceae bacterium]RQV97667.1 MAG: universal stress protein [Calditrichota bacterium]
MIKSILCAVDGSPYSESVLRNAIYLAKQFDAIIRALTVVDIRLFDWTVATGADSFVPVMPSADFQAESQRIQEDKAKKVIDKAGDMLKKEGMNFELKSAAGIPVDEICDKARQNDLVVMGIRGEYERWSDKLLGVTLESVSRQISKPLMLVDRNFVEFNHIICGYDGSNSANKALQLSAFLSKSINLTLDVIMVSDSEEERSAVLREAEKYLQPYQISFNLCHDSGDVADVLVEAQNQSKNKPLIIIGSYGHSRLREAILGSTTIQVMRTAKKPIILAK